jgi:hypothetical protein
MHRIGICLLIELVFSCIEHRRDTPEKKMLDDEMALVSENIEIMEQHALSTKSTLQFWYVVYI